ncbi:hypothetical protein CDL15_Pgr005942 [Punica granatum]|uniref:NAF domain-containing protein n=1 Tax=Punica granatum TaxID=22663 RepID=A0A218WFX9_PUNGR|nr:hypothetical protein CDL15_Pgr005942 [Punica granatum]
MNAFEMVTLPQGLNLSALFDRRQVYEVASCLFMVDVRKTGGDTLKYHKVCLIFHNIGSNKLAIDNGHDLKFYVLAWTLVERIG